MDHIILNEPTSVDRPVRTYLKIIKAKSVARKLRMDTVLLLALVVGFNLHLLGLGFGHATIFVPAAVRAGEWWRLATHPFVHVTWYHLLLDAGAFFILYADLKNRRALSKVFCLILCAGAALVAGIIFCPLIDVYGLCGLSGTAHGLMAFSGLQAMQEQNSRRLGLASFLLVATKSIYEVITGAVFFDFMHMGLCGTPVAACHFGGVCGGTVAFLLLAKKRLHG